MADPSADAVVDRALAKKILSIGLPVLLVAALAVLAIWQPWRTSAKRAPSEQGGQIQRATVGQYAGVMSSPIKSARESWQHWREEGCDFVALPESPICTVIVATIDIDAQLIGITLRGAAKPGVPAYLGAPPAELDKLVTDTIAYADTVDHAIPDDDPAGAWPGFAGEILSLMNELDRWDPYL